MDELSRAVGGERKNFSLGYLPRYLAPFKYLLFFAATQVYLFSTRPDVVYAQNPPVFCPLACVPYCSLSRKKLIVDHHNVWSVKSFGGSFLSSAFMALERVAASTAFANTVPHSVWKERLSEMSGRRVTVVHDFLEKNPFRRDEAVRSVVASSGLVGIASGHQGLPLERVEVEAKAAEQSPGVTLAITGPPKRLAPRIQALGVLHNVKYLGYLPKEQYERLKASSDFGLNISDEPFTVNHILFEYAAASLPTISIRRDVIEAVFGDSLVYVDRCDATMVAERIRAFVESPALLAEWRERTAKHYGELAAMREVELSTLKDLISSK